MVYTQEIAVLHSAFLLAERQSPTPLLDLDKTTAKVMAAQLHSTLQEIVDGPETAHKQFEQDHWSYKLTAILLEMVLVGQHARQNSCLSPVRSVLPRICNALFFEVVKAMKLGKWLGQCMRQLTSAAAVSLQKDLFAHLRLDPDDLDLSLLTDICQSFFTPSLQHQSESRQQHLLQSEQSVPPERNHTEEVVIATFFLESENLIPVFSQETQRLKLIVPCLRYVCRKLEKYKPTKQTVSGENITQQIPSKCEHLRRMLPVDRHFLTDKKRLKKLALRIDQLGTKDSLRNEDDEIGGKSAPDSCVVSVVEFLHKVLISHCWLDSLDLSASNAELARESFTQLVSICESESQDVVTERTKLYSLLTEICDVLRPCVARWEKDAPSIVAMETVAMETIVEKEGFQIHDALQRMDEKLGGYEDCLDWILSNSAKLYGDKRWIDGLEKSVDVMGSTRIVLSIVEAISTLREKLPQDSATSEVLWRLRKVLTTAYCDLPLKSQDDVLRQVLVMYGPDLLCSGPYHEGVEDDVITAFNRMVLLGEGQEGMEVFSTMCGTALQAPLLFLSTAVQQAVNHTGQAGVMSKLLQVLPSLCAWQPDPDSPALLCTTLHVAMVTLRPNSREENNLLTFVETLLQEYKPPFDVPCPFLCTPLLPVQGFTSLAVLPYIYQHYRQDEQLPLTTALKLLQTVLQQQGNGSNYWLQPQEVFPIILCLCQLLDDTSALWEEDVDDHLMKATQIQTLALNTLEKIQLIVLKLLSSESANCKEHIIWLHRKLKLLDWSCRLRVFPVLSLGLPELKKEVPDVLFTICSLPETEWLPLSGTLYGRGTGLVAMLECCRVSEEMADHMTKAVTVDVEDTSQLLLFQKGLTVALTQVLPQCVWQEWVHVLHAVQQLIRTGLLVVPVQQPQGTEDVLQVELSTSQQLAEVLQMLANPWTETWVSPSVWVHVVKNYVATMQMLQQSANQSDSTTEAQLFVIGQFFCHCCSIIAVAPGEVCQQLFVLALDMLTICQSLSTSANEEVALREKEELRQEVTQLQLHEGMKRTLQQKLDRMGQKL